MTRRAYRRFSKEFKLEAIRLADESGKPKAQVARELGIRVNQIGKWRKELEDKQEVAFSGQPAPANNIRKKYEAPVRASLLADPIYILKRCSR